MQGRFLDRLARSAAARPSVRGVLSGVMAIAGLGGCDGDGTTGPGPQDPKPVAFVVVTAPRSIMSVGERMTLVAVAKAADGEVLDQVVTWSSSDVSRATVDDGGIVTGITPGPVTISASTGGRTGGVALTLTDPDPPPVARVILSAATTTLEVGETLFVGVRLVLATGDTVQRPVTWTSSDPRVVVASAPELSFGVVDARGSGIATVTAAGGAVHASVRLDVAPRPTHDLVYSANVGNDGARWDLHLLGLASPASPTRLNVGDAALSPSPSPDGTRIVFAVPTSSEPGRPQQDLYVVARDGSGLFKLTRAIGMAADPKWSPDGRRVVFRTTNASFEDANLWVVNTDGSGLTDLTSALGPSVSNERHPAWSPDGSRIAFIAARGGLHKVWTMNADGTDAAPLMADVGFDQSPTWSPDGDRIAFTRYDAANPENGWDVMIVPATGGVPTRIALRGDQLMPAWSPDGHYIAVSGTRAAGQGQQNLYTLRPDGSALRLRTVEPAWGGGYAPAWITRR